MRFQKNGTQCRTQCQGVQCGQTDSDSHCQTELAIERTCRTTHETYRNKHGHHDQCDRYDSTTQFVHRIDRCQTGGCISLIELGMYTLDNHNRIIDHDRNGKHKGTQGQQVQTESDQWQYEECTDKGYRNSNGRNQGRTQILQEDIYYDKYQNKCLDQCLQHFVDRSEQEVVGVHGNVNLQSRRQCCGCFIQ